MAKDGEKEVLKKQHQAPLRKPPQTPVLAPAVSGLDKLEGSPKQLAPIKAQSVQSSPNFGSRAATKPGKRKNSNYRQPELSQESMVPGSTMSTKVSSSLGSYGVIRRPYQSRAKPVTDDAASSSKNGRWSLSEHLRFLEALKLYGKNWKQIEEHISTRTSTQARSHAQKFFGNIQKSNMTMEQYLERVSLGRIAEIRSRLTDKKRGLSSESNEDEESFREDNWELLMIHTSKRVEAEDQNAAAASRDLHESPQLSALGNQSAASIQRKRRKLKFERKRTIEEEEEKQQASTDDQHRCSDDQGSRELPNHSLLQDSDFKASSDECEHYPNIPDEGTKLQRDEPFILSTLEADHHHGHNQLIMEACEASFHLGPGGYGHYPEETPSIAPKISIAHEDFYHQSEAWRGHDDVSHHANPFLVFTSGQKPLGLFNLPGRERLISHDFEPINNNFLKPQEPNMAAPYCRQSRCSSFDVNDCLAFAPFTQMCGSAREQPAKFEESGDKSQLGGLGLLGAFAQSFSQYSFCPNGPGGAPPVSVCSQTKKVTQLS